MLETCGWILVKPGEDVRLGELGGLFNHEVLRVPFDFRTSVNYGSEKIILV